ncbi:polysaccharide biosynthesis/export family protein [Sphingomonas montana]|uniref:polysaccharide biosynthesis/export family protein n=1 Tax=Sphingomonas montana TaxID=1843236 RepID=UPI00096F1F5F|nr:polysaccharide biosynthesis/export family protein [Sphingomonas montana]
MLLDSFRSTTRKLLITGSGLALAGCATLPSSGPTAAAIERGAMESGEQLKFSITNLDPSTIRAVAQAPASDGTGRLAPLAQDTRTDVVGPGDTLAVSIYEVGVSLFGGAGAGAGAGAGMGSPAGATMVPSARAENFPAIVVDREGTIRLPYIGRLGVAGLTPSEIQRLVEQGLRGKSQSPQALVTIRSNVSNTVYVSGDVRRPGRLELTLSRERLLDAIASAGGGAGTTEDTILRFTRGNRSVEQRLSLIRSGAPDDLVLVAGDRLELIRRPRSYTVFGASGRASQISFENGDVSLAEALARAGGPNDAQADPSAVFLFRYESAFDGNAGSLPKLYRLNLMKPESYFLSQRVTMRDKDVIYIANARANQPAKLINVINQLFSPFITARAITR